MNSVVEVLQQLDAWTAIHSFMERGGPILWGLLALSVLLWSLILERYWYYWVSFPRRSKQWLQAWQQRQERRSWFARNIRQAQLSEARVELDQGLSTIKLIIAVCPLFGLLGTVTGMIEVFEVLAVKGTGEPRLMAAGVSRATIPTMAGMVVALSGLYFSTRLQGIAKRKAAHFGDKLELS